MRGDATTSDNFLLLGSTTPCIPSRPSYLWDVIQVTIPGAHWHWEDDWMVGYQYVQSRYIGHQDGTDKLTDQEVLTQYKEGYALGNEYGITTWISPALTEEFSPSLRIDAMRWGTVRGVDPLIPVSVEWPNTPDPIIVGVLGEDPIKGELNNWRPRRSETALSR